MKIAGTIGRPGAVYAVNLDVTLTAAEEQKLVALFSASASDFDNVHHAARQDILAAMLFPAKRP